jgi:hypothetical protein
MGTDSPEETKANYVRLMGTQAGEAFAELMQDAARLHLKWNEFKALYVGSARRIEAMNKSAPGFFFLTQNSWWNDIILHIFRMTDDDRRVLSIPKLSVPPELADGFKDKLATLKTSTRFAHTLRNEYIAHRNREVALQVRPIPASSVQQIETAIVAIDDALHFIDHHFTNRAPTMYTHLDILGGSESVIWIVRRGLKARDEDLAQGRLSVRFPD